MDGVMGHSFISNQDETRDRMDIPVELRARMVELARDFRKVQTPSERLLWTYLRGNKLGARFRRQQPIGPFVVDFYCPSHLLIVEGDGPIHETQLDHDRER